MQRKMIKLTLLAIWLLACAWLPVHAVTAVPEANIKKIVDVKPIYPPEARDKKISGSVTIEAQIDETGKVNTAKVTDSADPLLNQAALDAVRQWRYEPYIGASGKPEAIATTVVVSFVLASEPAPKAGHAAKSAAIQNPQRITGKQRPRLVKRVDPIFPAEALNNKISGVVVMDATMDTEGNVVDVVVVSGHPLLNDAAVTAIKQWKYKPYLENGVAKPVKFTVTVTFSAG
jgi:TonB family protein